MNHETNSSDQQLLELVYIAIIDILRHFRSIIFIALFCAIAADIFSVLRYEPSYRSEATFALKMEDQHEIPGTSSNIEEIATAFGYIISSNLFKTEITDDLNVHSLDGYYETSVLPNTNIIKISAVSNEPKTAYLMMNSMINRYRELSNLVLGDVNIELLQNISIPTQPFNPLNHEQILLRFGAIGMIAMILLWGILSFFSSTVKVKEDIEKMQFPLLGCIPKESKIYRSRLRLLKKKSILITQMSTSFRYIEIIKKIRHKLESKQYQVIMVTSSLENEGKTSVIANLALALNENHKKILLIDGDLRKPAIHKIFNLTGTDGIAQILSGDTRFESAITHADTGIDFVLGRTSYEDALERIESESFKNFIGYARKNYDYVLIDSVPSAIFSDSTSLAQLCDGYLLVIKQNFVPKRMVENVVDKLSLSQTPLIGCIFNSRLSTPFRKERISNNSYDYRYGYGYHYHKKYEDGENNG